MSRARWIVASSLLMVGALNAQSPIADSLSVQRLGALGRLWGVVKYFHPAFLARDVPWDSALVAAVPRVSRARSTAEYAAEVDRMLRAVRDPSTRVRSPIATSPSTLTPLAAATKLTTRWTRDSTLVIHLPCCMSENARALDSAKALIASASGVVFDFRGPVPAIVGEANDEFGAAFGVDVDSWLVHGTASRATERRRVHTSILTEGADGATSYMDRLGGVFRGRPGNPARRIGFVTYADSDLPGVAWALQNVGQGTIVLDDARGNRIRNELTTTVELGEGMAAEVRVVETIGSREGVPAPDTVVHYSGGVDAPLQTAIAMLRGRVGARPSHTTSTNVRPFVSRAPDADEDANARYPAFPYRLLAVFRYWNAVNYFYPSPMPEGTDWGDVLLASIRRMESAGDSVQYRLAMAAMTASLHDGHAQSPWAVTHVVGDAGPRVVVGLIEGRPVITRTTTDLAVVASGIRTGDVIVSVDGEEVGNRIARIAAIVPGTSRPGEPNGPSINRLLFGARGVPVRLMVERGDGSRHEVSLPRVLQACSFTSCPERSGAAIRFLAPDIGYADLASITESMVDSLFEMFRNTRAIVFDGRGRNLGAPPAIAARLSDKRVIAGRSVRPLVYSPDPASRTMTGSSFKLDSTTKWRYRGKTVMLINERAFSNQEQAPIFFVSANGTTLIGSPTAGGIGGLTFVSVPGGIAPTYPSSEGRFADGRLMHRIGVQPDIHVRPTIAGIRSGRDEVLERAIAYLRETLVR
jgi:C-terminal processing protease CtpA/Prc